MKSGSAQLLLTCVIIALFAYFVVAPFVMNTIGSFTVQKKFRQKMVDAGVIPDKETAPIQRSKQITGIVLSIITLALVIGFSGKALPYSILCATVPFALGCFKYRTFVTYDSNTVKTFKNAYRNWLDEEKYNDFVKKNF